MGKSRTISVSFLIDQQHVISVSASFFFLFQRDLNLKRMDLDHYLQYGMPKIKTKAKQCLGNGTVRAKIETKMDHKWTDFKGEHTVNQVSTSFGHPAYRNVYGGMRYKTDITRKQQKHSRQNYCISTSFSMGRGIHRFYGHNLSNISKGRWTGDTLY